MNTILLVDDSRVSREVIKVFLIGRHVRVIEAADGVQALSAMREHQPDLVIADLEMPKLDGLGLCQAIRADARLRNVPLLVLSGNVTTEAAQHCRAAGALEILVKPIQPQALLAAIARHLPQRVAEPGLREGLRA